MQKHTCLPHWLFMSFLVMTISSARLSGVTIYVKSGAGGANNGTTWADACQLLQDGLDKAVAGDQVWVAAGTYLPTAMTGGTGQRFRTFQMKEQVAIYGGFPNTGDPLWEDRDPDNYETILSGDIGAPGDPTDNCYHVFYHPNGLVLFITSILDGFTITGGYADGNDDHSKGGAIFHESYNITINNCSISDNMASGDGGGIYYKNVIPGPIVLKSIPGDQTVSSTEGTINNITDHFDIFNCTFIDNATGSNGAGMYISGPEIRVSNCTFIDNSAASEGGGIYNDAHLWVTNCTFTGNSANVQGGGIHNNLSGNLLATYCIFTGNSAADYGGAISSSVSSQEINSCIFNGNSSENGGGIFNYNNSPIITNCTFSSNAASNQGGGIYNSFNASSTTINCILWGNMAPSGPQIYNEDSSVVTYSNVQGGYPGSDNMDADPVFVDADGEDDILGTQDDDFHLKSYSPCIDKGDAAGRRTSYDIDGQNRSLYAYVDMGADEVFPIAGDLDANEKIDINDLTLFANQWLADCGDPDWCDGCDFNESGAVDLNDFINGAIHWLIEPPPMGP